MAKSDTNGYDKRHSESTNQVTDPKLAKGGILQQSVGMVAHLPDSMTPQLPPTAGSNGVIKSYVLPGNQTGVVSLEIPMKSWLTEFGA